MALTLINRAFEKLRHSRKALAIPATFLILFVTMLGIVSITYYYSVEKVSAQSQTLKISSAKQDMQSLNEIILSVLWSPESARSFEYGDCGGVLKVQPSNNSLVINVSDNLDLSGTLFNGTVGRVAYELPYAGSIDTGFFLKGDSRTVINQTGSGITQLFITSGVDHPEILLRYRPSVSHTTIGVEDNLPVNNLRVYVVNMNTSENIALRGKIPLKISCDATTITSANYNVSYALNVLFVTSTIDQESGQVSIPIESTIDGAIIHVEVVECTVKIARMVR